MESNGVIPLSVRWRKAEEEQVLIAEDKLGAESNEELREQDTTTTECEVSPEKPQIKGRTPFFVYVVAFFSIIGGFLFGYDTGVIAGALLELEKDFQLTAIRKELVVSVTIAAAALGALLGGPSNEKLGRKKTIMIASVIFAAGAIVMGVAPTGGHAERWGWIVVLVGRFIVGLGIGLASMTVPIYLAECAPTHMRGRLTVADNMAVTGGQFAAGVIDYGFSYVSHGWKYMLGIAAIPAIVRFIAFFFLPESPRWLVGKGEVGKARGVLRKLRPKGSDVEVELSEIREDLEHSARENQLSTFRKLWIMLTTRHLLLALTVGCGLQAIQQLSGINTVMYYSPTILRMAGVVNNHVAIGLGAVIAFGNFIFTLIGLYFVEKAGRRKLVLASLAGVILSLAVLGVAFFLANITSPVAYAPVNGTSCRAYDSCAGWNNCDDCVVDDNCHYCVFNDSYGSSVSIGLCVHTDNWVLYDKNTKNCHLTSTVITDSTTNVTRLPYREEDGLCTVAELNKESETNTFQHCPNIYSWLTLAALCMYIISFSPGMGPIPWTVNAEIYPNWARSVGTSASTTTNWVSNLLVSITFLHLTRYLTRYGAFWLYSGIAVCGWIFLFLLLPETKGRTLEQVEELFQRPLCPPLGLGQCPRRVYHRLQENQELEIEIEEQN